MYLCRWQKKMTRSGIKTAICHLQTLEITLWFHFRIVNLFELPFGLLRARDKLTTLNELESNLEKNDMTVSSITRIFSFLKASQKNFWKKIPYTFENNSF